MEIPKLPDDEQARIPSPANEGVRAPGADALKGHGEADQEIRRVNEADLEAAFRVALSHNAALRALCEVADERIVSHSWKLGHCAGELRGLLKAMRGGRYGK